ncbi:MAG TPA: hypothetical protein VIM48_05495 [Chthoniobacterales bacterium]
MDALAEWIGSLIKLIHIEFAESPRQTRPAFFRNIESIGVECVPLFWLGNARQCPEQRVAITTTTPFVKFVPRHSSDLPYRFAIG